jgi:hypothetical protein
MSTNKNITAQKNKQKHTTLTIVALAILQQTSKAFECVYQERQLSVNLNKLSIKYSILFEQCLARFETGLFATHP